MDRAVDILHPLTALQWRECGGVPFDMADAQAVCLKGQVFVGGGTSTSKRSDSRIYVYTPATDAWDTIDTPVYWFGLTVYHSQLVLVGGMDYDDESPTNKLWTLGEHGEWQETIPPMDAACIETCSVSYGDHLLVLDNERQEVNVYNGQSWARTHHLPSDLFQTKSVVIGGCWYVIGENEVYYASLDLLIAGCHSVVDISRQSSAWKRLPNTPSISCCPVGFGSRVIAVGLSAIYAYSQSNMSWVCVGDIPIAPYSSCAVTLHSNELMVMIGKKSFMITVEFTPFDLNNRFSLKAVYSLESAGIPLMTSLNNYTQHIQNALQLFSVPEPNLSTLLKTWLIQNSQNILSPTWTNLLKVIRELHFNNLAQTVETYLRSEEQPPESKAACAEEINVLEGGDTDSSTHWIGLSSSASMTRQSSESTDLVTPTAISIWNLPGVEVCDEMSALLCPSVQQPIIWEGFGLKLLVDKNTLPVGIQLCELEIKASLAGQYEFPENCSLVSAVFWLRCEPMCKFTKPVTVEIQHCAKSENVDNRNLKFVRALCSQAQLPYTFKEIGGDFNRHSSHGVIQVNGFSGLAIVQKNSTERRYLANVLSKERKGRHAPIELDLFFVIICNTSAHRTVISNHDRFKDAQVETDQPLEFESDQVEFKVSQPARKWKITRLNSSVVRKQDVDTYLPSETSWIPYSQFRARFHGDATNVSELQCDVDVIGAKHPHNQFAIDISPECHDHAATPTLPALVSPPSPTQRLVSSDLPSILQQLSTHAARWKEIGLNLTFTQGELDNIEANPLCIAAGSPKSWLSAMLSQWLEWAPGDRRGSKDFSTLEGLREALMQINLGATAHDLHL